jgi:CBS domain-containing protein
MPSTSDPTRVVVDRVKFLRRVAPFDHLPDDDLRELVGSVQERVVPAGEAILVEGGPPGRELYVVRRGTLELIHKDAYVAVVPAGEVVGYPTLLTGLAPEFTVRAREETLLYCLPHDAALAVLTHPAGVTWMAANSRERLLQAAGTMRALPDVRTLPVTSVTRSKPLFCDPATTAQEAAKIMIAEKRSAILVRGPGGKGIQGIVTDVDLRNKVVVDGVSRHAPVTEIMSSPVHTIGAEVLAPEASIAMMAAGVNHMPVLDGSGDVVGILSASSLMSLESRSPFALRREIMAARSSEEVVKAAADIPQLVLDLMTAHLDGPSVTRVLTVLHDSLAARFIELAQERLGEAPVAFAWLAFGSAARAELTMASDQDNGLAYDDTDDPRVAEYFRDLARAVNAGLESCGLPADPHGVLARRAEWRMSLSRWKAVFEDCLDGKDLDRLARASVAFDYRQIAGELYVDKVLTDVLRQVPGHKGFLSGLVKLGTKVRPPLTFRGRLEGSIDIKKNGLVPIQNLARYYAFASGITAASTLDRLVAVRDVVGESVESERVLREAFTGMEHLQLRHHANRMRNGRPVDNIIETWTLPPLTRASLQEALREVVAAQKRFKPVEAPR